MFRPRLSHWIHLGFSAHPSHGISKWQLTNHLKWIQKKKKCFLSVLRKLPLHTRCWWRRLIRLKDPSKIVNIPPYRLPHNLLTVVHEYVDKLLEAGVIRHSTSPFSSPIMLVRKAGADPAGPLTSTYRVVHNYVRLNSNLDTCSYPLRHVQDLIDEVAAGKVRSIFDLSQGFFNQTLDDPQGATAFSVPGRGLFEYLRSPMGVASSPAYFQRLLDFVLRGLSKTWASLDDVVVVSDNWDEHLKQLEAAFTRFREHNLKLNKKKVQLGKAVVLLGVDNQQRGGHQAGRAQD